MKKKILETDLYNPVRNYLTDQGYEVKGEVRHCDVTAVKDDTLLVVEMKTSLNLDVILQAALRQRMTHCVYIAVPKNSKTLFTKRWQNICYLLRRLEIGLLLVSFKGTAYFVEEALRPEPFSREMSRKLSGKKRKLVLQEFSGRQGDYNMGGSTRKKLVTAYREMSIHIAALLESHGPLSVKALKDMGTDSKKTPGILQDNHYGWFDRVSRGVYALNEKGKEEINNYRELAEFYINQGETVY
ncbi:MAG: DUF2161 domain-containing phosphodiesterase [Bacillota bacterium]